MLVSMKNISKNISYTCILLAFYATSLQLVWAFENELMPKHELKFAGCTISAVSFMKDMAKAYMSKYQIGIQIMGGGVPVGIQCTLDGTVDMGGSCRHLLENERKAGAVSTLVGYDMLVIIVHPSNPVESLNLDQVKSIFSGKISNWQQVGGSDEPIIIVGRESDNAGVSVMFQEMVMKHIPISEKNRIPLQSSALIEKGA